MVATPTPNRDLSHWDTKDELTVNESVWLAVGEDPIEMSVQRRDSDGRPVSSPIHPKQQLLLSHVFEGYKSAKYWARHVVGNCAEDPNLASQLRKHTFPTGWIPVSGKSNLPGSPKMLIGPRGPLPFGRVKLLPTDELETLVWARLGKWSVQQFEEAVPDGVDGDSHFDRPTFQEWLHHLGWRSEYVFDQDAARIEKAPRELEETNGEPSADPPMNAKQRKHYLKVIAGLLDLAKISPSESASELQRLLESEGQTSLDRASLAKTIGQANELRKKH